MALFDESVQLDEGPDLVISGSHPFKRLTGPEHGTRHPETQQTAVVRQSHPTYFLPDAWKPSTSPS